MSIDLSLYQEIVQFLYREVALLDDRRFEEWVELFTADGAYLVPNYEDKGYAFIIQDDINRLRARAHRLLHPLNPTQQPIPKTLHLITNIMVNQMADEIVVHSKQVVYVSQGNKQIAFPGSCEYVLQRHTDGGWRIRRKTVSLINNDQPLTQLPIL